MRTSKLTIGITCAVIVAALVATFVTLRNKPAPAGVANDAPTPTATGRESLSATADDILSKLKPGMLRVDVEALLGPPSSVESVQSVEGKLKYRATFTRDRGRPPLPPLLLEFDASQTGHPLLLAKIAAP